MRGLVPWKRAAAPVDFLRHEFDALMQQFFGPPLVGEGAMMRPAWEPRVDVEETDAAVLVKADLPGVDPAEVEVAVVGDALVLRGEKKTEHEEKRQNVYRLERFQGAFYREVPLPVGVDVDKIAATAAKGVLTITIPKKAEVQPKKVAVKALT
jgi:HSP20 family protein